MRAEGVPAEASDAADVASADLVACCTTAREPVFDGRLLPDDAVVVACGSHQPDVREVDAETVYRCGVLVESVTAACAKAGDVVLAMGEGMLKADDLIGLAAVTRGETSARPGWSRL